MEGTANQRVVSDSYRTYLSRVVVQILQDDYVVRIRRRIRHIYSVYGLQDCTGIYCRRTSLVLDTHPHDLLTGAAAEDTASKSRLEIVPNNYCTTPAKLAYWHAQANQQVKTGGDLDIVGAIALDVYGKLAATGSTGGLTNKSMGQTGDTTIMGAGLLADKQIAIVCSGNGDDILSYNVASKVNLLHRNMPLGDPVRNAITSKALTHLSACTILALNRWGQSSVQSSGRAFLHTSSSASGTQVSCSGTTIPLLRQHVFYQDRMLSAGFTRYPISSGHTLLTLNSALPIMSLKPPDFLEVLRSSRQLSWPVCSSAGAKRCGLVSDGGSSLSLIPLLGLSDTWEPVVNDEEEFHFSFSGYLTSKNGPKLNDSKLTAAQTKILGSTSLKELFDYSFHGSSEDRNLFARLIRGEVPQLRVWDDKNHIAFWTPFANTTGFTVLVSRKHLSNVFLSLEDQDYTEIITAAYQVAQHLTKAFRVAHRGIFFEGFEIDYAHIKLVPVHAHHVAKGLPFSPLPAPITFQKKYDDYLTSQFSPLAGDLAELAKKANGIREILNNLERLNPPGSWSPPEPHVDVSPVKDALKMHESSEDHYRWHMDIRDEAKGGKPLLTTGWGMGMERFLCWLLGHDNVRDVAIIPRLKGMRFQP